MSLGELERGNDWKSRIFYKVLSFASGQELAETERQKLRKYRKQLLEENQDVEYRSQNHMDVLIDMGIKEAKLMDAFEPDLIIVTREQYQILFDIPATVDPKEGAYFDVMDQSHSVEPPMVYETDGGSIDVTYTPSAKGMLLVESSEL